jgi:hypothetical protein
MASPAGLEPATCGLEIRCCYPAELRGRDRKLLPQERLHLLAPQWAAPTDTRGPAAWGERRRCSHFFPSARSARCETGIVMHRQFRRLISQEILLFLSNFATGLTLDVPAFAFSIAAAASFFWSTALV